MNPCFQSAPLVLTPIPLPILLTIYCVLIVLASLVGGWLSSLMKLTHVRMQVMMIFVSGLMFGIVMLHMLPQAAEQNLIVGYVLAFSAGFFLCIALG